MKVFFNNSLGKLLKPATEPKIANRVEQTITQKQMHMQQKYNNKC